MGNSPLAASGRRRYFRCMRPPLFSLWAWLCFHIAAQGQSPLANPGFENEPAAAGWETVTYGAKPAVLLDRSVHHEGTASLKITATQPSDTALAQEITLHPKSWYRASAWVRTDGLNAQGGGVSAALQIQLPHGAGYLGGSPSLRGTNEWVERLAWFQTPADGRVRLSLFFVGFGKGTGAVWFDDIRVQEINPNGHTVRFTPDTLLPATINPMQYGQFVEYLCDLVPAMWAERLYDGGFEGLTPYKFAFIKETDFREMPWRPSGAVNRGRYDNDRSTKVGGNSSKRIECVAGDPATLGLSQDEVWVVRGETVQFRCWMRRSGFAGPVRVSLSGADLGTGVAQEYFPTGEWAVYSKRWVIPKSDEHAVLTIEFRGPGTLWLDNVSLTPMQTVGGWRPDVVKAVRDVRPSVIRFGGSALDEPGFGEVDWTDTVGDPDHRRPLRAWGGLQPAGAGLEEIVQFCQAAGAEPLVCVRFSGRTPRDAADEVEYFNGDAASPMGARRAQNGHSGPYGIRLWQVGNERQSADYDQRLPEFCRAMRAVDPSIHLLSSFPSERAIRNAGQYLDYVCPHQYTPDLGACADELAALRPWLKELSPDRAIRVGVTEWNTTAGSWGLGRATLLTLANALACSRYHNLLHRNCDLVEIANRSNLINSFGSGIIQTKKQQLYKSPTYYAQLLYANLAGDQPLRVESDLPADALLDLSATRIRSGDAVVVFAVNDTTRPIRRTLDFSAFGRSSAPLTIWTLGDQRNAGEPDVRNTFDDPRRIAVFSRTETHGARFEQSFPALSLTVLRWPIRGRWTADLAGLE